MQRCFIREHVVWEQQVLLPTEPDNGDQRHFPVADNYCTPTVNGFQYCGNKTPLCISQGKGNSFLV